MPSRARASKVCWNSTCVARLAARKWTSSTIRASRPRYLDRNDVRPFVRMESRNPLVKASAVTCTSRIPGFADRIAWATPSRRCVLPSPTPPWITKGLKPEPIPKAISRAAARARREPGPAMKSSSLRASRVELLRGRSGAGSGFAGSDWGRSTRGRVAFLGRPMGGLASASIAIAAGSGSASIRNASFNGRPTTPSAASTRLSAKWPRIHSRKKPLGTSTRRSFPSTPRRTSSPNQRPNLASPTRSETAARSCASSPRSAADGQSSTRASMEQPSVIIAAQTANAAVARPGAIARGSRSMVKLAPGPKGICPPGRPLSKSERGESRTEGAVGRKVPAAHPDLTWHAVRKRPNARPRSRTPPSRRGRPRGALRARPRSCGRLGS